MRNNHALWLTIATLFLVSLACNAFAGEVEPALPPPPPLDTGLGTAVAPQPGESAIAPTVTLPGMGEATATLDFPVLQALVDVNVRTGPGVTYEAVAFMQRDEMVPVLGKDPVSGWWLVECPPRATGSPCWVTGRADFTAVTQPEAVPTAEAPPTATPQPQPIGSILAFVDNGRLFVLPLNMNQAPVTAAAPILLVEEAAILDLHIAPNGRAIAYRVPNGSDNALTVVNVDGSGSQLLVAAAELPVAGGQPATLTPWIDQVSWLPDGQTLLFNTELRSAPGSGTSQEDLWRVSIGGEPEQLFPPGSGAGRLAVSPTGQVLMSRSNAILRRTSSGSESLISFSPISASSGGRFYPQPQWTSDGTRALVAIPAADQRTSNAQVDLWQIPAVGSAFRLGNLDGFAFAHPVRWSPDGNRLGYVRQLLGETPQLLLAGTGGSDLSFVLSETGLAFWGWGPDNLRYLYSGPGFYAIGELGQSAATFPLPAGTQIGAAQWLTADTFILAVGSSGAWTLTSGAVDGRREPLTPLGSAVPLMAVWTTR